MGGVEEVNGGPAGMPKVARDESFKRPGAVPFRWEVRPGVPKKLDQPSSDNFPLPPSSPQKHQHPLLPPPPPMSPQFLKLTRPPSLVRSASTAPGPRRRELFSVSFSDSFSLAKRSNFPSRFAAGPHWRFWERGRSARHSVSSPSGSTLSSETVLSSESPSPRLSTGSSETASSVSD